MEISRREFIAWFGAAAGASLIAGGLDEILSLPERLMQQAQNGPGIETWKNTVCRLCPGGCGIRIRLIDGVPVGLKGNPIYPVNKGGMCPLGHSALQRLYSPDRLKGPVKRVDSHGKVGWQPLSWEDAITVISDKIHQLQSAGKSHQTLFLGSTESCVMQDFITRFMQVVGSPNYYRFDPFAEQNRWLQMMQGVSRPPAPDLLNARTVLSLGLNFLEEGRSPVYFTKLYSQMRAAKDTARNRFIQVDPRMNLTAAKADRWIPIRPGTYGALALGLAYVLIREELYDTEFVTKYVLGFEEWQDRNGATHQGLRNLILDKYYPDQVAEITGIPGKTILELGRELGNNTPSIVLTGGAAAQNVNGSLNMMAAQTLNLLLGNLERPGGLLFIDESPLARLPELNSVAEMDKPFLNPDGAFSERQFIDHVIQGAPYPLELLFLYGGNPIFRSMDSATLSETLQKIPLKVSFSSYIDETSLLADLILPDHTFLEKWELISDTPGVRFRHAGMVQPVVDPFYDTRNTGDVLLEVTQALGEDYARQMPWDQYQSMLRERLQGLYSSGTGAIVSQGIRESWLEYLRQRGWHAGRYDSFEEFWQQMLENGGWWDPIHDNKPPEQFIQTGSGKIELYSSALIDSDPEKAADSTAVDDEHYLPHYAPVPEPEGYPLFLNVFCTLAVRGDESVLQPLALEMMGYSSRKYWQTWVEMNPDTAHIYGVGEGDTVWVESLRGSLQATVHVHPGIAPDVVAMPFGLGHTAGGRFASGIGENPFRILQPLFDTVSGQSAIQATKVKIKKVV